MSNLIIRQVHDADGRRSIISVLYLELNFQFFISFLSLSMYFYFRIIIVDYAGMLNILLFVAHWLPAL